jgi:hypothetical protein
VRPGEMSPATLFPHALQRIGLRSWRRRAAQELTLTVPRPFPYCSSRKLTVFGALRLLLPSLPAADARASRQSVRPEEGRSL